MAEEIQNFSFSYSTRPEDHHMSTKITYPKPHFYAMKVPTSAHTVFYPMEVGTYSYIRYPTCGINLFQGFNSQYTLPYNRTGSIGTFTSFSNIYHLPLPDNAIRIGRSLSKYV